MNYSQGKEILEYFIDELLKSGVTYLPPFENKDSVSTADSAIDISKERAEDEGFVILLSLAFYLLLLKTGLHKVWMFERREE